MEQLSVIKLLIIKAIFANYIQTGGIFFVSASFKALAVISFYTE